MKNIFNFIFSIILAICIITMCFITIGSHTVLSESYALKTLEEEDYYNNCYWLIKANFENYIYQSGLDEKVLDNIITKEKVTNDIKIIIANIFKNTNTEIDTTEIKDNLNKNIEDSLEGTRLNSSQKEAIDEFVNQICNEYKATISFHDIVKKSNFNLEKIINLVNNVKKFVLILLGIDFLILLVLNLNRMYKFVSWLGVSIATNGFIMLFISIFTRLKIKIKTITIINDFISEILRKMIFEVLNIITVTGIISIIIAIVTIVFANIKKAKIETNEKKRK